MSLDKGVSRREAFRQECAANAAGLPMVLADISIERLRQDRLWGEQNHSPWAWYPILGEEFGEVGKELADALGGLPHSSGIPRSGALDIAKYRTELIHTAAVAAAAVEALDRGCV